MPDALDWTLLTSTEQMQGETDADTRELHDMLGRAEAYIAAHDWASPIAERYLGFGLPGVVALFLFVFDHSIDGTDTALWIVVGDAPSAYFVVDEAPTPREAMLTYCELMREWITAVSAGTELSEVFPVVAPADDEHAEMLRWRVEFIEEKIVPLCEPQIDAQSP